MSSTTQETLFVILSDSESDRDLPRELRDINGVSREAQERFGADRLSGGRVPGSRGRDGVQGVHQRLLV